MSPDDIKAALAPFGATLTDAGYIAKGDKATGVRAVVKGKRICFEMEKGDLLASGPRNAAAVERFVSSFWFWTKERA